MTDAGAPDRPVNLDNIREILGNDPEREKELFQIFIDTAEESLAALRANRGAGGEETWRTQAHAMKGLSLNLGAVRLGELCADAQKNNTASQEEKDKMLADVESEYAKVKAFLHNQASS